MSHRCIDRHSGRWLILTISMGQPFGFDINDIIAAGRKKMRQSEMMMRRERFLTAVRGKRTDREAARRCVAAGCHAMWALHV